MARPTRVVLYRWITASATLALPTCGTDAVGVDTCRDIEAARCEAASHCPDIFEIHDVEACRLYYRDQCLHGLAIQREPGAPLVRDCVEAIEQAGRCADRDTPLDECGSLEEDSSGATSVCELIGAPELLEACSFLVPAPEEQVEEEDSPAESSGAGGAGGAASGE